MDVPSENMEPPPGDTQPSGKIRKGFKLFGKRKPGNIFSIRSKGDVMRAKTLDGVSEMPDPEMEKEKEVSQAEEEQPEEEQPPEDGVLSAARHSISSACSAKSLGFLSMLRGGRRGRGDRRSQTVSQPASRQRRGLKGLFGSVKFHSKDKEGKEDTPPSPLLMSSRANSVEIIKEDLTLTPKSQPRSPNNTDSGETRASQDASPTSQTETVIPKKTAETVSKPSEHVRPLSPSEAPLVPGETSLSSLLEDISSLLTFDTISGGGDIVADVEAEWGKAMKSITTEAPSSPTSTAPKPTVASTQTSTSASTPSVQTPVTRTVSSPAKPSTIITTLTKTSSLTTHSSSYSSPAAENFTTIKSMLATTTSTTSPVMVKTSTAPKTSSPLLTIKSAPSNSSATTAAPPTAPATALKTLPVSQTLTSTASKLSSDTSVPPPKTSSVSESSPVTPAVSLTTSSTVSLATSTPSFSKLQASPMGESHSVAASSNVSTQPTSSTPPLASTTLKSSPVDLFRTVPNLSPTLTQADTFSTSKPAPSLGNVSTPAPPPSSTPVVAPSVKEALKPTPSLPPQSKPPPQTPVSAPETPHQNQVTEAKAAFVDGSLNPAISIPNKVAPTTVQIPISAPRDTPQLPVSQPKALPEPCKASVAVNKAGQVQPSVSRPLASPHSPDAPGSQTLPSKTLDVQEAQASSLSKEKKTPQGKASGMSKIPVVGGGRAGKPTVRNSQSFEDEANRDPPTPVHEEDRPHFNSHDTTVKHRISDGEVANSKQAPEESRQAAKAAATSPRDSKIPVKHGASQIPTAARTKIPVSRVPVRRPANKPAAAGSTQIRK
ncbi:uncharacterized protein ACB058_016706 [Synchiropus picturatus]